MYKTIFIATYGEKDGMPAIIVDSLFSMLWPENGIDKDAVKFAREEVQEDFLQKEESALFYMSLRRRYASNVIIGNGILCINTECKMDFDDVEVYLNGLNKEDLKKFIESASVKI